MSRVIATFRNVTSGDVLACLIGTATLFMGVML